MNYSVIAAFLLLNISCSIQDSVQKQNSTVTKDVNQKQSKTVHQSAAVHEDDPIIIDGSTANAPITEITPNGTTDLPPTPSTPTTAKPSTTTPNATTPAPTTTTPPPTKPTNATTPTPIPTNATTPTPLPPTPSSTVPTPHSSAAPTTSPPPTHHRGFDGPSFVGGIVLALGLVAIGFVAFKFYKARTELNYHTL